MTTPLILLPGMMCDGRLFKEQLGPLSARVTLHLAKVNSQESIPMLAREILAHAPPRFSLAGLSMGGIVAMEMYRQAPDRIDRLALMDTNPLAEQEEIKSRRGVQIIKVREGGLMQVMREEMKPLYLIAGPQREQILDLCMDMALKQGEDVFIRQSVALKNRPDQQDTLRGVTVPTLILHGEGDQLCSAERHQLMHNLVPGSELVVVEGAGHLPSLEQPKAFTRALLDWLQ